ncbi:hypothetical protein IM538_12645 [Cytobacillus suaedae]|nr:hypothetical protein IM538_12645 [Cytobacillus suaedae]
MLFILISLLVIISIACFVEGNSDRKGLKLTLSISLALFLSFITEASGLILFVDNFSSLPLMLVYYSLPLLSFSAFQLLLYDIRLFDK